MIQTQAPGWEWYYVALYFFIGGTAAGAYFIGSLVELVGTEHHRPISRMAFYIAFPLTLILPILLIADLGRPERFWHLFYYVNGGIPAFNFISPLSVGSWALLLFGLMALLSFLDNLVEDGHWKFAPFANLYNRIPRKLYAVVGSLAGFFIASYTGVLIDLTARPLWAGMDPLLGVLFLVSSASTGAAAIALGLIAGRMFSTDAFEHLENFDRLALVLELVLIVAAILLAGQLAAPLMTGVYAALFWGGVVLLGILIPLALNWYAGRQGGGLPGSIGLVTLAAVFILIGGMLLRISIVQAGQV